MKKKFVLLKYFLMGGWCAQCLYRLCSNECKKLIDEDLKAYARKSQRDVTFIEMLFDNAKKPFRNVVYYRFQKDGCNERMLRLYRYLIKPLSTIEIGGNIGGGLKIVHNYCVVSVKTAGKNLMVSQGVTIGKNIDGGLPVLGDNVSVFANAVIFGDVVIGNDVKIGAGSVVNKSIKDNSVVVGNPAKIV